MGDSTILHTVKQFLLNPKDFVVGNLRTHLPAWQQFFVIFGHTSKTDSVLDWIKNGVSLRFVHPRAAEQTAHPRFGKRIQLVAELLAKTVGAEHVQLYLDCEHPQQVQFANRVSCSYFSAFVLKQRDELLASGALVPWVSDCRPRIINGLGVVTKASSVSFWTVGI